MKKDFNKALIHVLPLSIRSLLYKIFLGRDYLPAAGEVDFGNLRRVKPIDSDWGCGRGSPIDRYYIENFLLKNSADIKGRVLDFAGNHYTVQYGGDKVTASDIMNYVKIPTATIVGDLATAEHIPSDRFDCIILTQVLPFVYDIKASVKTLHRILKPGGVVLVTLPGITKINQEDLDIYGDYWRFTRISAQRIFEEEFSKGNVEVESKGNVLVAASFLYGIAKEELTPLELDQRDPDYEVIITVRAVK